MTETKERVGSNRERSVAKEEQMSTDMSIEAKQSTEGNAEGVTNPSPFAVYQALSRVLWRGTTWAVTKYGIERLDGRYWIAADRLFEDYPSYSWPEHIAEKGADFDPADFAAAWREAIEEHWGLGEERQDYIERSILNAAETALKVDVYGHNLDRYQAIRYPGLSEDERRWQDMSISAMSEISDDAAMSDEELQALAAKDRVAEAKAKAERAKEEAKEAAIKSLLLELAVAEPSQIRTVINKLSRYPQEEIVTVLKFVARTDRDTANKALARLKEHWQPAADEIPPGPAKSEVRLKSAAGETAVKIVWLMRGYLARGKFHILAGVAGTGKSTISFDMAATITCGGKWPDGSQAPVGDVLIWLGEDGFHDTILPRFLAAGGNPDKLYRIDGIMVGEQKRSFNPATDVPELMTAMRQLPNLRLVIIDPIVAMGGKDSHRNTETRLALQSIVDLAEELDVVVLGITHFTKGTEGRDPLERVTGSLAYGALARIVLAAAKSEDENGPRRLVRAKSNIDESGGGFEYHLRQAPVPDHDFLAQRITWSTRLSGSARELLDELNPKEPSQRAKAIEFLERTLQAAGNAGVAVKALRDAANGHGISWATVRRVKDEELAGKIAVKQNEGAQHGGWYWVWIGGAAAGMDAARYGKAKSINIHPNNGMATVDRDDDEIPW
jgi:putative DNA primase/helicase